MIERGAGPEGLMSWGPHCQEVIPTESLLKVVARDDRNWGWIEAVKRLSERTPSTVTHDAMLRALLELEMPSDDPAISGVDDLSRFPPRTLVVALAVGGEDELMIVARHLASRDDRARLWAAHVFAYATSLPLDMPELLPMLDKLTSDANPRIADRARHAAAQYRSWSAADLESWAALASSIPLPSSDGTFPSRHAALPILAAQDPDGKTLAIQVLGRRRAFCGSRIATAVLKTLSRDGDARFADLARRAITLRRERCGDKLVGI